MSRFLYTNIGIIITSLFLLLYLLINKAPTDKHALVMFICLITIAVSHFLTLPIYFLNKRKKKAKELVELKKIYRKAFKRSAFITVLIIGLVVLRINNLLSLITGISFITTYLLTPYLFSKLFK